MLSVVSITQIRVMLGRLNGKDRGGRGGGRGEATLTSLLISALEFFSLKHPGYDLLFAYAGQYAEI